MFCGLERLLITDGDAEGISGQIRERAPIFRSTQSPGSSPFTGRYQLVTMGNSVSTFLIDTSNGCVWHLVQNEKTKRPTFIEADVENLHWGWGSGAQQILAAQIEALNKEEQKIILK